MQAIDLFIFPRNALYLLREILTLGLQILQLMLEVGDLDVALLQFLLVELMLRLELVLGRTGFLELCRLDFEVLHSARVGTFPFLYRGLLLVQEVGDRYQLVDPVVAVGEGPFELLDRTPMGGFSITQLDLQLMDAGLCRFQLLDLGTESVSAGKVFVKLGDLVAEDTDLLLLNLAGLLGSPTGLQGILDFVRLSGRKRIELTDSPVALRNGLLELLDHAAMDGFPIAQFNLQLMHTVSGRL